MLAEYVVVYLPSDHSEQVRLSFFLSPDTSADHAIAFGAGLLFIEGWCPGDDWQVCKATQDGWEVLRPEILNLSNYHDKLFASDE